MQNPFQNNNGFGGGVNTGGFGHTSGGFGTAPPAFGAQQNNFTTGQARLPPSMMQNKSQQNQNQSNLGLNQNTQQPFGTKTKSITGAGGFNSNTNTTLNTNTTNSMQNPFGQQQNSNLQQQTSLSKQSDKFDAFEQDLLDPNPPPAAVAKPTLSPRGFGGGPTGTGFGSNTNMSNGTTGTGFGTMSNGTTGTTGFGMSSNSNMSNGTTTATTTNTGFGSTTNPSGGFGSTTNPPTNFGSMGGYGTSQPSMSQQQGPSGTISSQNIDLSGNMNQMSNQNPQTNGNPSMGANSNINQNQNQMNQQAQSSTGQNQMNTQQQSQQSQSSLPFDPSNAVSMLTGLVDQGTEKIGSATGSDATTNIAMGMGASMVKGAIQTNLDQGRIAAYSSQASGIFNWLKQYFAVNHKFVMGKLSMLIVPFKGGVGRNNAVQGEEGRQNPLQLKTDPFEPELYVPLMGWITYIVIVALHLGLSSASFSPAIIATTVEWSVGIGVLENLIAKIAFSSLDSTVGGGGGGGGGINGQGGSDVNQGFGVNIIDLISLTSYKYVHLAIISLGCLFLPSLAFWPLFGYLCAASAFVLFKFLINFRPVNNANTNSYTLGILHKQVIMIMAGCQVALIWFMLPSFSAMHPGSGIMGMIFGGGGKEGGAVGDSKGGET